MSRHASFLATAALATVALAAPANALTFTLTDTGGAGVGTQARAGFEAATYYWSSVFTDQIDVSLNIGFRSLGPNILGSTGSSAAVALTEDVYAALGLDAKTALDTAAVAGLKPLTTVTTGANAGLGQLAMTVNATAQASTNYLSDRATRFDADGSGNNIALAVNTANMKALGFTVDANGDPFETPDGDISFSSDFLFDFDPTDGITGIDFIGVAIHEIGHALGFVSGVDIYDYYTYDVAASTGIRLNRASFLDPYAIGSALDLFRYNAAGSIDWSTSATDKYFSIDGGVSKFNGNASFSLGAYNGDGNQASHWKEPNQASPCTNFVGIMNPYICNNTGDDITADDLAAFDAMGWDVNVDVLTNLGYRFSTAQAYTAYQASLPQAAVPEPATWVQMLLGFGLIGFAARSRRRSTVSA